MLQTAAISLGANSLLIWGKTDAVGVQVHVRGPRPNGMDDSVILSVSSREEGGTDTDLLALAIDESQLRAVASVLVQWADLIRENNRHERARR